MLYTERDSKIGICQGGAQNLSQAKPAPKQLNLKSLAMQADLKVCGCPTQAEPIFESRAVSVGRGACVLRVGVIGINFKTADLQLRESIARGAEHLAGERALFFRHPTVLLSTCNRTEIYFHAEDLVEAHIDVLALLRASVEESFDHRLYSYFGIDCLAHLCRVAAGLDSAILAETEIQRQVKVAYEKSSSLYRLPGALHYLFQKALKVGKTVRRQLELERGAPSLYGTLWRIAEQNRKGKRILLVGYSEINRGFAAFLSRKGIQDVSFVTTHPSLVRCENGRICGRSELDRWREYDLIVAASKAERYLIQGAASGSEHLIFDLSVPECRSRSRKIGLRPIIQHRADQPDYRAAAARPKRLLGAMRRGDLGKRGPPGPHLSPKNRTRAGQFLKFGVAWESREGDDVADVFHAGDEEDEPLEAEAETGVGDGAIFAQLEIPPVVFRLESEFRNFFLEEIEPLFALDAADDLPDFRDEDVHRRDGFSIGIGAHVEGFDLCAGSR